MNTASTSPLAPLPSPSHASQINALLFGYYCYKYMHVPVHICVCVCKHVCITYWVHLAFLICVSAHGWLLGIGTCAGCPLILSLSKTLVICNSLSGCRGQGGRTKESRAVIESKKTPENGSQDSVRIPFPRCSVFCLWADSGRPLVQWLWKRLKLATRR